ncbi:RcnB family protein [Xenophilus azovorans]|uniref:RcnB family protein n=1 Tax=Xenophilus azovorans TaxID=151755 RepID=UPI00056DAB4F|nr:RcnB family protein [Xenophilus azovorans]
MKFSKLTTVALAASLGLASIASAQPFPGPGQRFGHGPQQHQPMRQHGPSWQTHDRYAPGMARGAGPQHRLHRGQRLPSEWRQRQHVVTDWRARHLAPPPRGQQWVQVGTDFALVAVATGLITSLLLNN